MKLREAPIPEAWRPYANERSHAYVFGDMRITMSDDDDFGDGDKWRHVAVSCAARKPSYDELYAVRKKLFPLDAEVVQVFPPRAEHVNNHPHCLHMWWNKSRRLTPRNMADAVGIKGVGPLVGVADA